MILNKTLSTPQRLAKARNRRIDQEYGNNSCNIHELFQCQLQDHTGTTPVPHPYTLHRISITPVPYPLDNNLIKQAYIDNVSFSPSKVKVILDSQINHPLRINRSFLHLGSDEFAIGILSNLQ